MTVFFRIYISRSFYLATSILFTWLVNLDFKLEALFLWMMFFFSNLSIIAITLGNFSAASFLSSVLRNAEIALRVVFA